MTTGRINQVTIVAGVARRRAGVMITGRGRIAPPGQPVSPRTESGTHRAGHPFATPEFSKARVRSKKAIGTQSDLGISASEGGSPSSVTPRGGYRFTGVPPNASISTLTIGQQPTEPSGAAPLID